MIYEKLDLGLDITRLREHLKTEVLHRKAVMQGEWFGGWSVLSSNGSYQDGWGQGHTCYDRSGSQDTFNVEHAKGIGLRPTVEYKVPTEVCTGYLAEVIQKVEAMGFSPRRARISILKAGGASSLHRDGLDDSYAVRLHVPIITNESCTFVCEEGAAHLAADGSAYILRVNRMHQVFNRGRQDRFHLIMDVWDTRGVTSHHRYDPNLYPKRTWTP